MAANPPGSAIPRSIHAVWFGPSDPPYAWLNTWRDAHPTWNYRLWREDDIESFGLANLSLWRSLIARGIYDAASDVARIEVLERHGGVYVDADSVCLRPMDDAPFLGAAFFATAEIQPNGTPFVTNAFMGSAPHSDVARRYVAHIGRSRPRCTHGGTGAGFCCAWRTTGPAALTRIVRGTDALILPASAFFRTTITGEPVVGEPGWGEHFWSSTTMRSPAGTFAGRGYEEGLAIV